jgi:hypothetical protein
MGPMDNERTWHPFDFEGRPLEWATVSGSVRHRNGELEVEHVELRRAGSLTPFFAHYVPAGTQVNEGHAIETAQLFFEEWPKMIATLEKRLDGAHGDERRAHAMAALTHARVIGSWRPLVDFDAAMRHHGHLMVAVWREK